MAADKARSRRFGEPAKFLPVIFVIGVIATIYGIYTYVCYRPIGRCIVLLDTSFPIASGLHTRKQTEPWSFQWRRLANYCLQCLAFHVTVMPSLGGCNSTRYVFSSRFGITFTQDRYPIARNGYIARPKTAINQWRFRQRWKLKKRVRDAFASGDVESINPTAHIIVAYACISIFPMVPFRYVTHVFWEWTIIVCFTYHRIYHL